MFAFVKQRQLLLSAALMSPILFVPKWLVAPLIKLIKRRRKQPWIWCRIAVKGRRPLSWWSILNAWFSVLSPRRSHKPHLRVLHATLMLFHALSSELKKMQKIGIQHKLTIFCLFHSEAQKHTLVWSLYWRSVRENVTMLWVSQAKTMTEWLYIYDWRWHFFILCPSEIMNC